MVLSSTDFMIRYPVVVAGLTPAIATITPAITSEQYVQNLLNEAYLYLDSDFWGQQLDRAVGLYVASEIEKINSSYTENIVGGKVLVREVKDEYLVRYQQQNIGNSKKESFQNRYELELEELKRSLDAGFRVSEDVFYYY